MNHINLTTDHPAKLIDDVFELLNQIQDDFEDYIQVCRTTGDSEEKRHLEYVKSIKKAKRILEEIKN
jgi:RAB protein geranylgeranyltransferase component A